MFFYSRMRQVIETVQQKSVSSIFHQ